MRSDKESLNLALNAYYLRGQVLHLMGKTQKALSDYKQGARMAGEENELKTCAHCYLGMSRVYFDIGDRSSSHEAIEPALKLLRKINDKKGEADCLLQFGRLASVNEEYEKALKYYGEARKIQVSENDLQGLNAAYDDIGSIYRKLHKFKPSLSYFLKSLDLDEQLGMFREQAITLNNIGTLYHEHGRHEEALEYYKRALKIRIRTGDKRGQATTLVNIGTTYAHLKKYEKALKYQKESLEIREQIGNLPMVANSLNNVGMTYQTIEKYDKALPYFRKALKICEDTREIYGEIVCNLNLGAALILKGKTTSAEKHFSTALSLSIKTKNKYLEKTIRASIEKHRQDSQL
ncbi:tetratricopeptide repeat protein [bacterium]|nr:tetratricopeptide repeat protein [bacterium]